MTAISIELAKRLRDIQESREIRGFAIDSRYSGRYMYDETCLGITVDYICNAFDLILKLENPALERELTEFFSCCSWDSMGYPGVILYARGYDWPSEVKLADDEDEEDEFDDEDEDEDESSDSD